MSKTKAERAASERKIAEKVPENFGNDAVEHQIQFLTERAKAYIEGEVSDTDAGRQVFNKNLRESLPELENDQQRFKLLEELRKQSETKWNSFAPFKKGIEAEYNAITETIRQDQVKKEAVEAAKQAQAKKEAAEAAEERIADLNRKNIADIISQPVDYIQYSNQYNADKNLAISRSSKMDTLLEIEEIVGKIVNNPAKDSTKNSPPKATRQNKRDLKKEVKVLIESEPNDSLINKHMGSILRQELKRGGIKVERTWGQFFADNFRNHNNARNHLKNLGLDVKDLVTSMQNHAKNKTQTEQLPAPKQQGAPKGRAL